MRREQRRLSFDNELALDGLSGLPPDSAHRHPPTPRALSVADVSPAHVASIARALTLNDTPADRVAATILAARGWKPGDELLYSFGAEVSSLPDPSAMLHFDRAIERILTSIQAGQCIGIVGDYDSDGVTAIAQGIRVLRQVNAPHVWHVPNRRIDGYGISDRIVRELLTSGCGLVLLFDHGTHNHREVAELKRHGVDCVIFDHHTLGTTIPDGVLVNPNQLGCGFHDYRLCASGISMFVWQRVCENLRLPVPDRGLAAIGTIADVVPLIGPNRAIVRQGLEDLRRGGSRAVTNLAFQLGIDITELTSSDVAFYLAPAINAAGRLEDASECVECLVSDDEVLIQKTVANLVSLNAQRKELQRDLSEKALDRLGTLRRVPSALVCFHQDHHAGVVGLVAQGLAQRYARPAFVFAPGDPGELKGSARSGAECFDLMALLADARSNDTEGHIVKAGGHRAAAGLSIRAEGLQSFTKLLCSAVTRLHGEALASVPIFADAVLRFSDLSTDLIRSLHNRLDPYGQGFDAPRCMFEGVRILEVTSYPGGRRLIHMQQGRRKIRGFLGSELWDAALSPGAVCDIIATPSIIYQRDTYHTRLAIQGYRVTSAPENRVEPPEISVVPHTVSGLVLPVSLRDREDNTRESTGVPLYKKLQHETNEAILTFPNRFLYSDLAEQIEDPFGPDQTELFKSLCGEFRESYDLQALRPNSFRYRPEQIEFCRFFLDSSDNMILQAPTGSGKTEMAMIVASRTLSRKHKVFFAAPTIDIARQVWGRSQQMLEAETILLDGATSPEKRREIHARGEYGFVAAVPHVIENDLNNGALSFHPGDLLIIDEGHHASGRYPYVSLAIEARRVGARVLLLSATPAQIESGRSWRKLDDLKQLLGVTRVFPLNVRPRHCSVRPVRVELPSEIRDAATSIIDRVGRLQQGLEERALEHDSSDLRALARLYGRTTATVPGSMAIQPFFDRFTALKDGNSEVFYTGMFALQATAELSELYHTLLEQGIAGFLLRVVEKRCELLFPVKGSRGGAGTQLVAPPASLRAVYGSSEIRAAYAKLAKGSCVGLWKRESFERATGLSCESLREMSAKDRRAEYNRGVSALLRQITEELITLPYDDHPKERYLVDALARVTDQSIVYTRDRSHALFLAKRLTHMLSGYGRRAVALTGSGNGFHRGLSRREREENLALLNRGAASIMVITSAGIEGLDLSVELGFAYRSTASHRQALQLWGRLGRRGVDGSCLYLCSTVEELSKVNRILAKEVAFREMVNRERAAFLEEAGSSSPGALLPPEEDLPEPPKQKFLF